MKRVLDHSCRRAEPSASISRFRLWVWSGRTASPPARNIAGPAHLLRQNWRSRLRWPGTLPPRRRADTVMRSFQFLVRRTFRKSLKSMCRAELSPAFFVAAPLMSVLLLSVFLLPALSAQSVSSELAASCTSKYNALREGVSAGTVNFSEGEINSWLAFDLSAVYPDGVRDVSVQLQRNNAIVLANVDFDRLKVSVPNLLPDL